VDSSNGRKRFIDLVEKSKATRDHVRKLVEAGRWQEAEPDRARLTRFTERNIEKAVPAGAEAIQGPTNDLQAASFLAEGAQVRRSIAYVEVNTPQASEVGSGFLVSPRLFLTNQHVIRNADAARGAQITFDREMDESGTPKPMTTYLLDPDTFALFSDEQDLDYALVAVGKLNSGSGLISDFGCCVLSDSPDRHVLGMNVNIIQHPRGWPKMISVRNNIMTYRTETTLLYETDTDEGSSGSPVFNDDWDLVALHHWGQPFLKKIDDEGRTIPVAVNEGIRISAIYRDLQSRLAALPAGQQELLKEVFVRPASSGAGGKALSPPRPSPPEAENITLAKEKGINMGQRPETNDLRIILPIEITVRLGTPSTTAAMVEAVAATTEITPKALTRGAEALKIDKDYDNRDGYDPDFVPDYRLPLPEPKSSLAKQIAPLRPGEPNADEGELKYEHFSIKLNKSKRMAMFTATNIDGETYLTVDRKTGEVTGAEGETWYKDPRISEAFFTGQSFYSEWSIYFDRGHLTRRTDPTWGTEEAAERANADTYHFTNCSPQHFRFNQTTKYWQGAERYVLEKGLFAADSKKRISVFQGPIFDDKIDNWAGDLQIPSSFFKIIVWKGAQGLKAVGLVVDQLPLLSEQRKNLGQPKDGPPVDVSQWRVAISQIEKRTGLNFGDDIRDADTITSGAQPAVGSEAARPIRSPADILA
jgi:endonuclease G, mitochondrial